MSTDGKSDGLLAAFRVIIWILMIFIMIAGAVFVGLFIAIPLFGADFLGDWQMPTEGHLRWVVMAMLGIGLIILFIALKFFSLLLAIIDTVGEGDPFIPDNADRLEQMGWLALLGSLISIGLFAMAVYVKAQAPDAEVTVSLDPSMLLVILLLFILARVFRIGAEMRADLDDTV